MKCIFIEYYIKPNGIIVVERYNVMITNHLSINYPTQNCLKNFLSKGAGVITFDSKLRH